MPKISLAQEQQRRAQILAAAMTCFARQGYHATSMDDVVRESGLSVGAIYSYFASKEDLFLALSDDRAEQTLAYLNEVFRRPGPMADKSREAVDYFFRLLFFALRVPLKIVEMPVRYRARTYGETKIRRFAHGWLLLRMTAHALRKFRLER